MADRVTKTMLENMAAQVNTAYGTPGPAWARVDDRNVAAVGHIHLAINSPGDGWSRYHLMVTTSEGGGETYFGSAQGFRAQEMYAYLRGILDGTLRAR